ncbi:uncharacterized protein L203_102856 [Cryptococcus depauperatus CBS 7841]|uniref:Mediator of RNA polymerase II transcription subunit 10 n=1 Tax=Cryptococcus depauperatus CBS 7841 TaxID=1295531 RepID=A0A1E3IAX2_9TREE|nr:hypothetical protein L203_04657 [Cryptococcus depauperatus CBS 7841]
MSIDNKHLPSPASTPSAALGGSAPPTASSNPAAVRAIVESQLLRLAQDLYEMEISAGNVRENREGAVPNYLENINEAFLKLSKLSSQLQDTVPKAVVEQVDRYKNPHIYTRQTLTRATGENQHALGRVIGLETFRRKLHEAIHDNFPEIPLPDRRHQLAIQKSPEIHNAPPEDSLQHNSNLENTDVKMEDG